MHLREKNLEAVARCRPNRRRILRERGAVICDGAQTLRGGLFLARAFLGDFFLRRGFSGTGLIG